MKESLGGIGEKARQAERIWGKVYPVFNSIVVERGLEVGAEIGVAFGGHAEAILSKSSVKKLFGIDPYEYLPGYQDPMNLPDAEFEEIFAFVSRRLAPYGDRYTHLRELSIPAASRIPTKLDFVYLDADHSFEGVWGDLCAWFDNVREEGVIGGHDYSHPQFPGVATAVDQFFRRFDWKIRLEAEGVWWVEKKSLNVSYIVPAYNCVATVREAVSSIVDTNLERGDELVIVDDASTDGTADILRDLDRTVPASRIVTHPRNKGGGAARNTAVENTSNPLVFCLDADNLLVAGNVHHLKDFLVRSGADIASFQEVWFFRESKNRINHKFVFKPGPITLADYLAGQVVPGASGNYMFTKESWNRVGGYPEFAGALDTWGFGFRQLASGCKMVVMPDTYYFHRFGHDSYWMRNSWERNVSIQALQVLLPYLHLIQEADIDYVMSRRSRDSWFENMDKHPLKLKGVPVGKAGESTAPAPTSTSIIHRVARRGARMLKRARCE